MSDCVSERMRWLVKQFELSGQHRDTHIRLGAREVWLKCVKLIRSFRQSLKRRSLLGSHWVQFFQCVVAGSDAQSSRHSRQKVNE
jgi:hypothetical protein